MKKYLAVIFCFAYGLGVHAATLNFAVSTNVVNLDLHYPVTLYADPNNPLPLPVADGYSSGNSAYVKLTAGPGHAGQCVAAVGLDVEWDVDSGIWSNIMYSPVTVTADVSYVISADYQDGYGSANAGVREVEPDSGMPFFDFIGYETTGAGVRTNRQCYVVESTLRDLQEDNIYFEAYCQAHAVITGSVSHVSGARITVHSLEFGFAPVDVNADFDLVYRYAVPPGQNEFTHGTYASSPDWGLELSNTNDVPINVGGIQLDAQHSLMDFDPEPDQLVESTYTWDCVVIPADDEFEIDARQQATSETRNFPVDITRDWWPKVLTNSGPVTVAVAVIPQVAWENIELEIALSGKFHDGDMDGDNSVFSSLSYVEETHSRGIWDGGETESYYQDGCWEVSLPSVGEPMVFTYTVFYELADGVKGVEIEPYVSLGGKLSADRGSESWEGRGLSAGVEHGSVLMGVVPSSTDSFLSVLGVEFYSSARERVIVSDFNLEYEYAVPSGTNQFHNGYYDVFPKWHLSLENVKADDVEIGDVMLHPEYELLNVMPVPYSFTGSEYVWEDVTVPAGDDINFAAEQQTVDEQFHFPVEIERSWSPTLLTNSGPVTITITVIPSNSWDEMEVGIELSGNLHYGDTVWGPAYANLDYRSETHNAGEWEFGEQNDRFMEGSWEISRPTNGIPMTFSCTVNYSLLEDVESVEIEPKVFLIGRDFSANPENWQENKLSLGPEHGEVVLTTTPLESDHLLEFMKVAFFSSALPHENVRWLHGETVILNGGTVILSNDVKLLDLEVDNQLNQNMCNIGLDVIASDSVSGISGIAPLGRFDCVMDGNEWEFETNVSLSAEIPVQDGNWDLRIYFTNGWSVSTILPVAQKDRITPIPSVDTCPIIVSPQLSSTNFLFSTDPVVFEWDSNFDANAEYVGIEGWNSILDEDITYLQQTNSGERSCGPIYLDDGIKEIVIYNYRIVESTNSSRIPYIIRKGADRKYETDVVLPSGDRDDDGIPNWWEAYYFNGLTNAIDSFDNDEDGVSNIKEYIAGTDPVDPASLFELTEDYSEAVGGMVLRWTAMTNRTYGVYWMTNLIDSMRPLATNLVYPQGCYTDMVHQAESAGFYKVEVQLQ
ncbi:MAG: hypothetical protein JXR25_08875 [Pontiellaceae bacterium]|nr:hypothetical protein [Pontiellaceae bacterium]MBN2784928.1 hypothetical protein [Pontiellaceae bacterium]